MGLPGEAGGRGHPAGRRLGAAQRAARHLVVTVLKANAIFPATGGERGKEQVWLCCWERLRQEPRVCAPGGARGGEGSPDPAAGGPLSPGSPLTAEAVPGEGPWGQAWVLTGLRSQ